MTIAVVHDFLQETDEGLTLTVYLSRRDDNVEFASELGRFDDPDNDGAVFRYIRRRYPRTPINHVRVVTGDSDVVTLSYMSMMAKVRPDLS